MKQLNLFTQYKQRWKDAREARAILGLASFGCIDQVGFNILCHADTYLRSPRRFRLMRESGRYPSQTRVAFLVFMEGWKNKNARTK